MASVRMNRYMNILSNYTTTGKEIVFTKSNDVWFTEDRTYRILQHKSTYTEVVISNDGTPVPTLWLVTLDVEYTIRDVEENKK